VEGEGVVSERRRNTRESGEKNDWEAVVRGDSREDTRERDGWAHPLSARNDSIPRSTL
jgi:hypothetical protein